MVPDAQIGQLDATRNQQRSENAGARRKIVADNPPVSASGPFTGDAWM
jgi:hypothetical protein